MDKQTISADGLYKRVRQGQANIKDFETKFKAFINAFHEDIDLGSEPSRNFLHLMEYMAPRFTTEGWKHYVSSVMDLVGKSNCELVNDEHRIGEPFENFRTYVIDRIVDPNHITQDKLVAGARECVRRDFIFDDQDEMTPVMRDFAFG